MACNLCCCLKRVRRLLWLYRRWLARGPRMPSTSPLRLTTDQLKRPTIAESERSTITVFLGRLTTIVLVERLTTTEVEKPTIIEVEKLTTTVVGRPTMAKMRAEVARTQKVLALLLSLREEVTSHNWLYCRL